MVIWKKGFNRGWGGGAFWNWEVGELGFDFFVFGGGEVVGEGFAEIVALKVPDLRGEAPVGVVAGIFPDGVFGGDSVGEGFAHEGASREGGNVGVCEEAEGLEEEFVG